MSGNSPSIPDISATLPHPLFLRSWILSRTVPEDVIISPRYLWDFVVFIMWECTFSLGHGFGHFFSLPMCKTTLLYFESVSLWVSIKEFITAFFCTDGIPHIEIDKLSSTMPSTPMQILGSLQYWYVRWSCFNIVLFSMSMLTVHFKLPRLNPAFLHWSHLFF